MSQNINHTNFQSHPEGENWYFLYLNNVISPVCLFFCPSTNTASKV